MSEGDLISYLVVGVFGFILALVLVSVARRRAARGNMVEHDRPVVGAPSALTPPRRKSIRELGEELGPEVERLLRAGQKGEAVRLVHERGGLAPANAERVVNIIEKLL